MRFKAGFVVGCAVGALAVSKAAELRRMDRGAGRGHGPKAAKTPDATVARVKALGDLAKERFTTFLETPSGESARETLSEVIGASLARAGSGRVEGGNGRWPH